MNPLKNLFDQGQRALGYAEVGSAEAPHRIAKPAVASGGLDLTRELTLNDTGSNYVRLNLVDAGKTNQLDPSAIIAANSRVIRAGAHLFVAPEKPAPVFNVDSGNNHPGFYENPAKFRHVLPAAFSTIADGSEASLSQIPFDDADLTWSDAPNLAFRSKITRAQRRDVGGDMLSDDFVIAIALGLAEQIDAMFLAAVLAATPAAFSMGALAARHALIKDACALVGTAGAGASWRGDGAFVAAGGIPAELTAATAATVVGLFGRAAVGVRPELAVHVKRLNTSGDQELIVFANAKPLIPSPAADFWTAS